MVAAHQRSLFAGGEPALAPAPVFERVVLDATSWIDLARSWLLGTDALLDAPAGSVRVLELRGLASRAPYFHSGQAKNITKVLNFYVDRFHIDLNHSKRADLEAFLLAL